MIKGNKFKIIIVFGFLLMVIIFLSYQSCRLETISLKRNIARLIPETADEDKKLHCDLFILIMTSPKGITRRKAIRETWLNIGKQLIQSRFVIGLKNLPIADIKKLQQENEESSDLIFLYELEDSYQSLTLKLLKSFLWINKHVKANFIMKADDDTFVRTDILHNSLVSYQNLGRIYWGFFRGNAHVKRSGPWKETRWFLSDHYLPYALGGGYILSSDLLEYISDNAEWFSLYKSEDVSLGVWLGSIDINRIHDVRFDTEYKTKGCSNKYVVVHKQEPEDMYKKYDQLSHFNRLCEEESELILTYDYNWNVSPLNCCRRVSIKSIKI